MRIAYIAWGSLVCKPECLKIRGSWAHNGPEFPIEFARVSKDGRLTLVIHPDSTQIATYSVEADHEHLGAARANLRLREGPVRCETNAKDEWIASVEVSGLSHGRLGTIDIQAVRQWLRMNAYDAAVWTAIPPRWSHPKHGTIRALTVEAVVDYIRSTAPAVQQATRDYFGSVPPDYKPDSDVVSNSYWAGECGPFHTSNCAPRCIMARLLCDSCLRVGAETLRS